MFSYFSMCIELNSQSTIDLISSTVAIGNALKGFWYFFIASELYENIVSKKSILAHIPSGLLALMLKLMAIRL
jgi:hypothetical protein